MADEIVIHFRVPGADKAAQEAGLLAVKTREAADEGRKLARQQAEQARQHRAVAMAVKQAAEAMRAQEAALNREAAAIGRARMKVAEYKAAKDSLIAQGRAITQPAINYEAAVQREIVALRESARAARIREDAERRLGLMRKATTAATIERAAAEQALAVAGAGGGVMASSGMSRGGADLLRSIGRMGGGVGSGANALAEGMGGAGLAFGALGITFMALGSIVTTLTDHYRAHIDAIGQTTQAVEQMRLSVEQAREAQARQGVGAALSEAQNTYAIAAAGPGFSALADRYDRGAVADLARRGFTAAQAEQALGIAQMVSEVGGGTVGDVSGRINRGMLARLDSGAIDQYGLAASLVSGNGNNVNRVEFQRMLRNARVSDMASGTRELEDMARSNQNLLLSTNVLGDRGKAALLDDAEEIRRPGQRAVRERMRQIQMENLVAQTQLNAIDESRIAGINPADPMNRRAIELRQQIRAREMESEAMMQVLREIADNTRTGGAP